MAGDITHAVERWRRGDAAAQFDLERWLHPFLLHLIHLVRRRVDTPLQARIDSEGVVYAALNSFLTGVRKDEFPVLENRDDIKKILTTLVRRTLSDEVRWNNRERRSPTREVASADGQPRDAAVPETAALADDLAAWLEKLVAVLRQHDERAIEIVRLSLEGLSNVDIAGQLGLGLRRVQLLKKQMCEHWDEVTRQED